MTERLFSYDSALLIDDDATDVYINKRILEISRFAKSIVVQSSVDKAIRFLKEVESKPEQIPQVIFLDYFMPVKDGAAFIQEYAQLSELIRTKCRVVLLSVLDEAIHPSILNTQIVTQAIVKPLTHQKLEKLINFSVFLEKNQ